MEDLLLT